MPSGPSGIFSLVASYFASPGTQIRTEQHNPPLEDIANGLTQRLMRDGRAPMTGDLQMGARRITGMGLATQPTDAARFDQLPATSPYLAAVAALTMAADRLPYATGVNSAALATLTAFARTLLDDADAPTARGTLGLSIATAALAILNAAVAHDSAAWAAGTATTPGFPTPAQARASANSAAIGYEQSWQDVLSSRAADTVYTNSTGKPIQLAIKAQNAGAYVRVRQNPSSAWIRVSASTTDGHWSAYPIIAPGHQYEVVSTATIIFSTWSELR